MSGNTETGQSRVRNIVFVGLAVVWFNEMLLWGVRSLSEAWGPKVWDVAIPENPFIATLLYITRASNSPAKAALFVLAVFALRSKDAFARTALFVPMALIPPLNIAFQFRAQGFPVKAMTIATVLTTILWGSFVLFKEPIQKSEAGGESSRRPQPSGWEILQYAWFAVNSAFLTLLAAVFLSEPRGGLDFLFPCLSSFLSAHNGELYSLKISNLGMGTHLLALAIASWFATVYSRSNVTLPRAVTTASTVNAGLACLLPLRLVITEIGGSCSTSSVLVVFVPLLVGWVFYSLLDLRRSRPLTANPTWRPVSAASQP
jgi:hypothetical protein